MAASEPKLIFCKEVEAQVKWTLEPVAESDSGETTVHEVAILKRMEAFIKPASLGMGIEERKQIAVNIQACLVSDQVVRHNWALTGCRFCGQRVRARGYYQSIFKSALGRVPIRVRRVWAVDVEARRVRRCQAWQLAGTQRLRNCAI